MGDRVDHIIEYTDTHRQGIIVRVLNSGHNELCSHRGTYEGEGLYRTRLGIGDIDETALAAGQLRDAPLDQPCVSAGH